MRSISFFLLIAVFLSLNSNRLNAQSNMLSEYIQMGISNNLQLQKNKLSLKKQSFKIAEAKSNRLPVVTFEPNYLLAGGGRRLFFPVGDLFNPAYQTLNDLTQTNSFPTDLENVDEQLTPNNFHDTRIYATYPLFNPAIYYNVKAQEQLISVEQAKINAFKYELTQNIKTAYFNYLKTFEVLKVLATSENLLQEVYKFNQKLVKYDKATPDILSGVRLELEKIKSERASIVQQQQMAKAYFNALLNRDFDAAIEQTAYINIAGVSQDLVSLRREAINNRPELDQLSGAIKATQLATQIEEKNLLPTVAIQGTAGFQGDGYTFASDQALATLAIGAQWTIFDGKKRKHKIEQSKIEALELQREYELVQQQVELQVINAFYALESAKQRMVAEQETVNNAQEQFSLVKKRYENEKAILIEFLDAQTKLMNAKVGLAIARFDILIQEAMLERAIAFKN